MKLRERLLDLLFPPRCPFCGRVQERSGVCPDCDRALPWLRGEAALRKEGELRCAGALAYEGLAREGLLRFKFRGDPAAAGTLGKLVAQCAAEQFPGEFDTVTWVPVSRKRLRKRGYDQARELARSACRLWETEPVPLLKKVQDNPPQSGLSDAAARRANVLGVYEASEKARGKRILLIDDICTTGATLRECVRVLKAAGAEEVVCAAAALTPGKKSTGEPGKKFTDR